MAMALYGMSQVTGMEISILVNSRMGSHAGMELINIVMEVSILVKWTRTEISLARVKRPTIMATY